MTVRELVELNQMICDIEITVRQNGTRLLDALFIGVERGKKPRFPFTVPESERYIDNLTMRREATYIDKSINSWDDGKDYWQVKVDRIPKKWADLTVFSWEVWPASFVGCGRRQQGKSANVNFHGQRIIITALPSGESLVIREEPKEEHELTGQMNIMELLEVEE